MTARKAPEERKARGGARTGSGRKSKLTSMEDRMEWDQQLKRAITAAFPNMGCIKRDSFWTLKQIKERWGALAMTEFKSWFEAERHFDQLYADRLLQERLAEQARWAELRAKATH